MPDLAGGDHTARSVPTLRPGGPLVTIASGKDAETVPAGARTAWVLIETGRLRVEVDSVLPLTRAAEAHELGEKGRTRGKIVLSVGG